LFTHVASELRTLRQARAVAAELEARVAERTAELEVAISNLHAQIGQRAQVEAALRESETRYRRMVELSPEGIVVVGRGRFLYANAAAARLFGANGVQDLVARPLLELIEADARAGTCTELEQLAVTGAVAPSLEVHLLRVDGSSFDAELTAAGVSFDGQPAVQILIRDVGERKAVERMKDELLSVVSHELRTPLTSIRGALGLLAGGVLGPLPGKGQRMVEIAVSNADRLIRLLNDMLDLERMRAGRTLLDLRSCDMAELVEQAAAEMRGLADRAGVRLVVRPSRGGVRADPDRIVQVLGNLLSNAIKFSPPEAEVELSAVERGTSVLFSVRDQGRGIPADELERIFQPFLQVDASDARAKGGSGLGLAICRSIAEQHGGRVWAESKVGQGSTFHLELPAA
jgi:PAS domain S-box-containing protein